MKIIMCGDRFFDDYDVFKKELDYVLKDFPSDVEIVTGLSTGPQKMALKYAKENKLKSRLFKIDWQDFSPPSYYKENEYGPYNALAWKKRDDDMNRYIKENNGVYIIFWDEKNPDTKKKIDYLSEKGFLLVIVRYDS